MSKKNNKNAEDLSDEENEKNDGRFNRGRFNRFEEKTPEEEYQDAKQYVRSRGIVETPPIEMSDLDNYYNLEMLPMEERVELVERLNESYWDQVPIE